MSGPVASIELDADENAVIRRALGQSYEYLARLVRDNPTLAPAVDEAIRADMAAVIAVWGRVAAMENGEEGVTVPGPAADPSPFYMTG